MIREYEMCSLGTISKSGIELALLHESEGNAKGVAARRIGYFIAKDCALPSSAIPSLLV